MKVASTHEIIEKLQAFEKLYGVGAVESIASVCSGSRTTEYIFNIEDKNGNEVKIDIDSVIKTELFTK